MHYYHDVFLSAKSRCITMCIRGHLGRKVTDYTCTHTYTHTHTNNINWAVGDRDFREDFSLQTLLTFEFYAMWMSNITYF